MNIRFLCYMLLLDGHKWYVYEDGNKLRIRPYKSQKGRLLCKGTALSLSDLDEVDTLYAQIKSLRRRLRMRNRRSIVLIAIVLFSTLWGTEWVLCNNSCRSEVVEMQRFIDTLVRESSPVAQVRTHDDGNEHEKEHEIVSSGDSDVTRC